MTLSYEFVLDCTFLFFDVELIDLTSSDVRVVLGADIYGEEGHVMLKRSFVQGGKQRQTNGDWVAIEPGY